MGTILTDKTFLLLTAFQELNMTANAGKNERINLRLKQSARLGGA